MNFRQLPDID